MSSDRGCEQGITLVEMLIVSLILGVVVGGLGMVLAETGDRVWARTDGQLTTLSEAQLALDRFTKDLRMARQPVTCNADGSLTFTQLISDPVTHQLVAGPVMTYQCQGCTTTSSGTLTRIAGAGAAPQVMASGLTSFTGTCLSTDLVKVALTSLVNTRQGPLTHTLESEVWVRNPEPS